MKWLAVHVAFAVAAGFGGCIQEASRQSNWSCLAAAPVAPRDTPIVLRLHLLDEATDAPVAGATVKVCLRGDIDCIAPTATLTSDADGGVPLELVDEYVEIRAPGFRDTIAMGLASFELQGKDSTELDMHFDLYSTSSFASLARAGGIDTIPERADIEVLVRDCTYESAAGAVVTVDDSDDVTVRRYLVNDLPSAVAAETDIDSGSAIFFNAPPGLRSVATTFLAGGNSTTGDATPLSVIARPGWITQVTAMPLAVDIFEVEIE